jgi:hypothetical protein
MAACGGAASPSADLAPGTNVSSASGLVFTPEAGIRMDDAAIPEAGLASDARVHLYYQDNLLHGERRAISADGLSFARGLPVGDDRTADPRRVRMPDGTWRLYQMSPDGRMTSTSSRDGIAFTPDAGQRYAPAPQDNGTIGIYELWSAVSRVHMLYLGDLHGKNNTRRALSTDGGLTFTYQAGNVLGDDDAGGGGRTFVDITTLLLPDGSRRLYAMRGGQAIYSFRSTDDGQTFAQEPGERVTAAQWTEFQVLGLFDPSIVALPGGGYRLYVCGNVVQGGRTRETILSAHAP